ncbi:hypothetical protein O6R05_07325 [Peptoniphilus equinus]|uniref:DUF2325 domain-containing protein n=1 Tax=Peptoniphilus equinus TaxID=3016343 RepID=A0ABY7QSM8_9FIRM|nr:hypothetical protein [Peptoniphilus equinus]WBW49806.1 hypothetical protein O6R05_07325 [Peptoniphilus equinus]
MNKTKLLNESIAELTAHLQALSFDNVEVTEAMFYHYFEFLKHLKSLPNPDENADSWDDSSSETASSPQSPGRLQEIYDPDNNLFLGQTHLNLSGATIGSFKIFMPEKLLRKLGVDEGDWVRASILRRTYDHKPVYDYELVEKVAAPSNKHLLSYAVVHMDMTEDQFYIEATDSDGAHKILLDNFKIGNFALQAGDIVDYAYWNDDILNGKIIWIHPVDSEPVHFLKHTGEDRTASEDVLQERTFPVTRLDNIRVGLVGCRDNHDELTTYLKSVGATLLEADGSGSLDDMKAELSTAHVIVIFIDSVGHEGMFNIRNISKSAQIPIVYSKAVDPQTLVRLINEELYA